MAENMKKVTIKEMFERLSNKDAVKQQIADCSVGLVGIRVKGKRHQAYIVGSGTFVEISGKYGILTAEHVADGLLDGPSEFGLSIRHYQHRFTISRDDVVVIRAPSPNKEARRPDLAFMLIPAKALEIIHANKSFWSTTNWKHRVLGESLPVDVGFWILSGHPAAYSKTEGPSAHHVAVKDFPNKLCISGIEREYSEKEFDYFEASVDHELGGGIPKRLGGMSGGGLWQVPVSELENGQTKAAGPILLGVAFWQTGLERNRSRLICHGRHSIYKLLYDLVQREYSH